MPAGEWTTWTVDTADGCANSTAAVRDLVMAVRDHGVPFMRRNGNLKAICALIDEHTGLEHQLHYRRPVAWLLAGDRERARSSFRDAVIRLGDHVDPATQLFCRFGDALERRLTAPGETF